MAYASEKLEKINSLDRDTFKLRGLLINKLVLQAQSTMSWDFGAHLLVCDHSVQITIGSNFWIPTVELL